VTRGRRKANAGLGEIRERGETCFFVAGFGPSLQRVIARRITGGRSAITSRCIEVARGSRREATPSRLMTRETTCLARMAISIGVLMGWAKISRL